MSIKPRSSDAVTSSVISPVEVPPGNLEAVFDQASAARHLATLSQPGSAGDDRSDLLAAAKNLYHNGRAEIARCFDEGADGPADAVAQTFLMDGLIRVLFDHLTSQGNPDLRTGLAVVAVGGYGRGELAPFSDIDLLFARADSSPGSKAPRTDHSNRPKNALPDSSHETVIENMLYLLWDLGLKLGHATRSLSDNIRAAREDMTIRTSLLEARFIAGDEAVYRNLTKQFQEQIIDGSHGAFIQAKLAERQQRHEAAGNSRYLLEPNIKEGKGGLRDLHTLFWIARYMYGVGDIDTLARRRILTIGEARRFAKARNFLMTLRCHLHYAGNRPEERLTFDRQTDIGHRMGYRDRSGARSVERFMKHYFVVAKEVGDFSRIFLATLRPEKRSGPLTGWRQLMLGRRTPPGFNITGGWLKTKTGAIFRDDPVNLLRVFSCAHQLKIDLHPSSLRQVTRHLNLINQELRDNPEANRLFLDMLTDDQHPEKLLSRMSEAGVLGRFVPDFGRVIGLMQHDMYHVYTVDEHTIRAIGLLNGIETGRFREDHPLASKEISAVRMRRALYSALFMHDLGKGRGGDHSQIGATIVENIGPRLGLNGAETETASWLVRHHLLMSHTAFRRDINDPQTIGDFARTVESMERLRLLLILTVADIRAVGPGVWNAWKATLLRQLYQAVADHLSIGSEAGTKTQVTQARIRLRESLPDWDEKRWTRFESLGPPHYWQSQNNAAHLRQAQSVDAALDAAGNQDTLPDTWFYFDDHIDPQRDVTEITFCAKDRAGLFARIAGALAASGGDIVDARLYTLANGWALNILSVQDATGWNAGQGRQALSDHRKMTALRDNLTKAMTGDIDWAKELQERTTALPARSHIFTVPPHVHIDNAVSHTATVVEVVGRDHPGLLFNLAHTLGQTGLRIANAKISTYGERAVDVFYVKDAFGFKISAQSRIDTLQQQLLTVLGDGSQTDADHAKNTDDTTNAVLHRRRLVTNIRRRSLARARRKLGSSA